MKSELNSAPQIVMHQVLLCSKPVHQLEQFSNHSLTAQTEPTGIHCSGVVNMRDPARTTDNFIFSSRRGHRGGDEADPAVWTAAWPADLAREEGDQRGD